MGHVRADPVVIVFEFLITFDREVHFAWGRKLSWARSIFLLNRYLSILEYLFTLGPLLPVNTSGVRLQAFFVAHHANLHIGVSITGFSGIIESDRLCDSCTVLTRATQVFQILLYAVWAGLLFSCVDMTMSESFKGFSGLRIHAIGQGNWLITAAVIGLAAVPVVTNSVQSRLWLTPIPELTEA